MLRSSASLACALVLIGSMLVACGGAGGDAGDGNAPARRQFVSIGTAPPGGAFFVVGGALASVLNEFPGEAKWEVTAEATKGSQENIRRLASGEIDLALSNAAITYFAVRGEGNFGSPQDVRSVMTLAPNVALFIAPQSAGVRSIADLRGKRVVIGPAGAGFELFVAPLLAAHGLSYDDFTPLNNTQSGAVDMLADGSAAAAFLGGAVPTASITQAATQPGAKIVYVPYTEEGRTAAVRDYPFFHPARIPAGTYRGLDEDFEGLNVGSMHLITSAGADEDLIYRVTKTLWEHRDAVVEQHPAGRSIREDNVIRDTGTPFHPGAERFYREIGIWIEPPA